MTTRQMLCDSLTVTIGGEVNSTDGACARGSFDDYDDEE